MSHSERWDVTLLSELRDTTTGRNRPAKAQALANAFAAQVVLAWDSCSEDLQAAVDELDTVVEIIGDRPAYDHVAATARAANALLLLRLDRAFDAKKSLNRPIKALGIKIARGRRVSYYAADAALLKCASAIIRGCSGEEANELVRLADAWNTALLSSNIHYRVLVLRHYHAALLRAGEIEVAQTAEMLLQDLEAKATGPRPWIVNPLLWEMN